MAELSENGGRVYFRARMWWDDYSQQYVVTADDPDIPVPGMFFRVKKGTKTEASAQALAMKKGMVTRTDRETDAQVFALKKVHGATWHWIATKFLGLEWTETGRDGGRALRAYDRAEKAGVDPSRVKVPQSVLDAIPRKVT